MREEGCVLHNVEPAAASLELLSRNTLPIANLSIVGQIGVADRP
jgi:hypothetical protein